MRPEEGMSDLAVSFRGTCRRCRLASIHGVQQQHKEDTL